MSSEETEGQKHCGTYSGENTDQQDVAQAVRLGNFLLHWHVTHELHEVCGGNREMATMKLKKRRSSDHSVCWSVLEALTDEGLHGQIIQFRKIVENEGLLHGCLDEERGRKVFIISILIFIFRCVSIINKTIYLNR